MQIFKPKFPLADGLPKSELDLIPEDPLTQNVLSVEAAGIYDTSVLRKISRRQAGTESETSPVLVTLHGYLQSFKYFDQHRSLIQRQFTFSSQTLKRALDVLTSAVKGYSDSHTSQPTPSTIVGVHVRRGDILRPVMKKYGHTTASPSYITNLIGNLTVTHQPALFIVVSNDLVYCRRILSNRTNVVFLADNPPQVDMAVLSLMDHLILTVGTFGWWGAYLSDAQDVFYYRGWPRAASVMDQEYNRRDYFLNSWKGSN